MRKIGLIFLVLALALLTLSLASCGDDEQPTPPTTYTITYECDGGVLANGGAESYVTSKTETLPIAVKTGYTFLGWYESPDFTGEPLVTTEGKSANLVLYAKWEPITVKVEFYIAGVLFETQEISYGGDATLPLPAEIADSIPAGKVFRGWDGPYTGLTADTKIHANLEDAQTPPVDPEDPPVDPEDPPVDPEDPPVDPEDPPVDPEDPPAPVTHTIIYNTNGGTLSAPVTSYTEGDAITLPLPEERKGSTFIGWYTSQSFEGDPITTTAGCTEDLVLYAKWEVKTYEVTFWFRNPKTGRDEQIGEAQIVPYGGDAVPPAEKTFMPSGYSLIGWNQGYKNITSDRKIIALVLEGDDEWSSTIN